MYLQFDDHEFCDSQRLFFSPRITIVLHISLTFCIIFEDLFGGMMGYAACSFGWWLMVGAGLF
jgi:hypothetical protein